MLGFKKILKKYSKFFGLVFAVVISVSIFVFREQLLVFKQFGYIGLFALNLLGSATLVLPTPLFMTAFAAGSVLNPFIVTVVSSLGSALGELTGYWAGIGAESLIEENKTVKRVEKWMTKYGLFALFALSAVPNPIFDAAGIFAGATKIPVWKYILVVWLGKMIKFAVLAYLGHLILVAN